MHIRDVEINILRSKQADYLEPREILMILASEEDGVLGSCGFAELLYLITLVCLGLNRPAQCTSLDSKRQSSVNATILETHSLVAELMRVRASLFYG